MNTDSIKDIIVANYSKLARSSGQGVFSKLFACCDPLESVNRVGREIGYSQAELQSAPEGANLGVGCGNPSALARIRKGETVVDLGSGAGFDAFLVAPQVGEDGLVIGVDLSDDMLQRAQRNAHKGKYDNVKFIKGDIEQLPLDDTIANHVISNCVINLSANKGEVYKEAFRVLKPGGRLAVSDIVLEKDLPAFIRNSPVGHIACVAGAERLDRYLQYVEEAGFQDIEIETKASFPLELMLAIPEVSKLAKELNFDLNGEMARDVASRVISITLSAKKY